MAGTAPIVSRGFGSWSDVNLVVTAGYLSGAAPPPAAGGNVFILGRHRKRKASLVGSTLVWKSLWSLLCFWPYWR